MYWTTAPEDAINLKAIVGSHSQRRWSRAISGRAVVIYGPCINHIKLCSVLWFRWFCECVSLHCAFHYRRQNSTICVKWAYELFCTVQRPGADYNFLLWQMGWSGPQCVEALQCYCLHGCYSARCVPFSSRRDRTWTQIFYVFAHIEHLWLFIKLLDKSLLPISLMCGNSFNLGSGIVQSCARSALIWNLRFGQLIFMSDIPVWKTKINRGSSTMLLHQILDLVQMENLCGQSSCCWIEWVHLAQDHEIRGWVTSVKWRHQLVLDFLCWSH